MALVTVAQAVSHLRLPIVLGTDPIDPRETDLRMKLAAAEAVVFDYLKTYDIAEDRKPVVQAAILLQLGELWRFRGDDQAGDGPATTAGDLSPVVTNLLRRLRDPALA
jgi:hypothetical protein